MTDASGFYLVYNLFFNEATTAETAAVRHPTRRTDPSNIERARIGRRVGHNLDVIDGLVGKSDAASRDAPRKHPRSTPHTLDHRPGPTSWLPIRTA